MRVMNDIELSEKILEMRPDFPVIFSTGRITPEIEMQTRKSGIKHILRKPYSVSELLAILR